MRMVWQVEKDQDTRGSVDYGASVTSIDNSRLLVTYRSGTSSPPQAHHSLVNPLTRRKNMSSDSLFALMNSKPLTFLHF